MIMEDQSSDQLSDENQINKYNQSHEENKANSLANSIN
jgi:hypothetical protein